MEQQGRLQEAQFGHQAALQQGAQEHATAMAQGQQQRETSILQGQQQHATTLAQGEQQNQAKLAQGEQANRGKMDQIVATPRPQPGQKRARGGRVNDDDFGPPRLAQDNQYYRQHRSSGQWFRVKPRG